MLTGRRKWLGWPAIGSGRDAFQVNLKGSGIRKGRNKVQGLERVVECHPLRQSFFFFFLTKEDLSSFWEMEMKVSGLCFRKITLAALNNITKNMKMWVYSEEAGKNNPDAQIRKVWVHICERKEQVHFPQSLGTRTGGIAIPSHPQDKGRRGGKMCAERHRQIRSQIVCLQSPYFYSSRLIIIHTCYMHILTCICMHEYCMFACMQVCTCNLGEYELNAFHAS